MKCLTLMVSLLKVASRNFDIKTDNNLNFNNHIKPICRKTGQKLSALLKISSNLNISHKKLIIISI